MTFALGIIIYIIINLTYHPTGQQQLHIYSSQRLTSLSLQGQHLGSTQLHHLLRQWLNQHHALRAARCPRTPDTHHALHVCFLFTTSPRRVKKTCCVPTPKVRKNNTQIMFVWYYLRLAAKPSQRPSIASRSNVLHGDKTKYWFHKRLESVNDWKW